MDIFQREIRGEEVSTDEPEYFKILELITEAQKITAELNTGYHEPDEVREIMSRLTGRKLDKSFGLLPPFYTDYGKNLVIGKDVFINHACTFMDRGGITIEDKVLIAPKVNLITINHPLSPSRREKGISTICRPITVKRNAWIGAAATIMPGVTVGENSIVSAGAVVTRDVPPNTIVAGVPAKVIKNIEEA